MTDLESLIANLTEAIEELRSNGYDDETIELITKIILIATNQTLITHSNKPL